MEGDDSEFANFTLPSLKAFLDVCSQNVSGNKQWLVARAIGWPKTHFFHELTIFWSAKNNNTKTLFSHPPSSFPSNFCNCISGGICIALQFKVQLLIVIHSMKQCLLRNWPRSDTATSCNLLCKRLQRAFTRGNQLHWTAQYAESMTRPIELFQIPFLGSWPVLIAWKISLISLPRCVISVAVWCGDPFGFKWVCYHSQEKHACQILSADKALPTVRRRGKILGRKYCLIVGKWW